MITFLFHDHVTGPYDILLVHYIDDVLTVTSEQEVVIMPNIGETFACQRVGKKSDKTSEVSKISEIYRSPVVSHIQIPFKVKDKLLYLASFIAKNEVQHRVALFRLWMQLIPYLSVLFHSIYQVTQRVASFENI